MIIESLIMNVSVKVRRRMCKFDINFILFTLLILNNKVNKRITRTSLALVLYMKNFIIK